jgi:hypothetical protein
MSPGDIDPSLRTGEPLLESLDDGFSPPPAVPDSAPGPDAQAATPLEPGLGSQSPF